MISLDDWPWETTRCASGTDLQPCCHTFNVASLIPAATKSVAPNTTPARAYFPGCLAMTARKSATSRKSTAPKRSSIQEKTQRTTDPIVVTESDDAPAPLPPKQPQRKSAVPQLKPTNGNVKGKGKAPGLQRDDPIDLEPLDGVSDVSDVEMSVPSPRSRSSPNELSPVPVKEETLQRKLLQVSPPQLTTTTAAKFIRSYRARRPSNHYENKLTSCSRYNWINNRR